MATNARINYDVMEQVAGALGALLDRVVFIAHFENNFNAAIANLSAGPVEQAHATLGLD